MSHDSVIAMIPARIGSTRLPLKNLALMGGRPLVSYALRAALESGIFSRVVLNGDHEIFAQVASEYGAEFYQRPPALGGSDVKSDDVVRDFMDSHPCDIVAWVNSIAPLQQPDEIRGVIRHFIDQGLDSLFTVEHRFVHALLEDAPLNFTTHDKFAQTQDLTPVALYAYSMMVWRARPFLEAMQRQGYAFYTGKVGHYPISRWSSIIVKTQEDLQLAEAMHLARGRELSYHPCAEGLLKGTA